MNPVHPQTLFILMPGEVAVKRNSGKEDLPRWFSYPLEKIYAKICFSRRFRDFIYHRKPKAFLIFNVSFVEVLVALLFGRSSPIYSIYQWIPFEYLPWYKRVAYRLVLSRSRVIVVYNSIAEIYIRKFFPTAKVVFQRLWVDTEWFSPLLARMENADDEPYILCPGSHRRNEHLVIEISRKLNMKVIRFSQDRQTIEFYQKHNTENVVFMHDIDFQQMRTLYAGARLVINPVDDTLIPAGITCLIEALSMNCSVVTPGGHSSCGYCDASGQQPFFSVPPLSDVDVWVDMCRRVLDHELRPPVSPRNFAVRYCSPESALVSWNTLIQE